MHTKVARKPYKNVSDPDQARSKLPPAALLRIEGSASLCPQAFSRVLDRVQVAGGVPHCIIVERKARSIRFRLEVAGLAAVDPMLLTNRLRAIPSVGAVRIYRPRSARPWMSS
jgi:hypothetical protein